MPIPSSVIATSTLDLAWVRSQFPSLSQTVNGWPAIYFDAPGGTQVTGGVIHAISDYLTRSNANTHGAFVTSQRTDQVLADAHRAMSDFLSCEPDEIVFGPNMTTLTFSLSRALGRELRAGDEILTTHLDHDANVAPWRALEERGAKVLAVDINAEDCTLDLEDFESKLSNRTKIVAVGYASNAVGTINELDRIIPTAHAAGALVFVDAVHYAPHRSIDVKKLGCDFLACSTYKFFGPHVGVLYGRRDHLERLRPYKVRPAPERLPDRWETGTQNHEGLAGVCACVEYLAELGRRHSGESLHGPAAIRAAYACIQRYEEQIGMRLIEGLSQIPELTFYGVVKAGPGRERTPTVGIRLKNGSPAQLAKSLGDRGVFMWSGNFYALNLMECLGLEQAGGLLRIGLVHYNSAEEVDRLLSELEACSGAVQDCSI
jgi:cysteine desulfurase family protein (TIGR01976 family)